MSMHFSEIARQAAADGLITPDEILALRRDGWGDGKIQADEADALFAINDALGERGNEWCDFFVEAIGEYVLNTWLPKGYVTDAQAAWLIDRVGADGKLDSVVELELLVRVIERALNVPSALKAFVLGEIERAVATGSGPTRDGGSLSDRCVTETECHVLRRVIFAAGGERPGAVSRGEAEMLFRIKDAALGADNSPEWKRLFAQGVANYLMGYASLNAQLRRERAAELEAFMTDNQSAGRFLRNFATGAPTGFRLVFGQEEPALTRDEEVAAAEEITPEEQAWLDAQVKADGRVDEYEQALLDFIAEDGAEG